MKNIKGLILKDLLNLNHYKATLIITIIIFSAISISQKDYANFLPGMIIMMIGMIALSTFSYDELSKTDKFILTLPTNRKEIVKAKYILVISLTVIGAILAFIINLVISYFVFKESPDILNNLISILGGLFGVSLIQCIQIPSIYKWGVEKGRVQMFIVIAVIILLFGGIVLLTKNMNINFNINFSNNIWITLGISLLILVAIVIYFISYKISCKIYNKKEL